MWNLIKIDFNSAEDLFQNGFKVVRHLEDEFGLKELYFAHYSEGPYVQISFDSPALDHERIEKVVKQYPFVTNWSVVDRNTDTLCHAYTFAYSLCKELLHLDKTERSKKLYELFHWTQNMLGFSDNEEIDNYCKWTQYARDNARNRLKSNSGVG